MTNMSSAKFSPICFLKTPNPYKWRYCKDTLLPVRDLVFLSIGVAVYFRYYHRSLQKRKKVVVSSLSLILLSCRLCNVVCPSSCVSFLLYSTESFSGKCNIYHFICQACQILGKRLQVGEIRPLKFVCLIM